MKIIDVQGLYKWYGRKPVLRGLDFQLEEGEFVALLGPNGAGKTTFLRILSSLLRQTSGQVLVAGYHLPQQSVAVRQRLGVVTHLPLLYGHLTGEENLRFYGKMYGLRKLDHRVDMVLELIGLQDCRRDLVRTYSRGMQQRLAIGRAILHDPDLMLLDEPHTGLDQDACVMLDSTLLKVMAEGKTIIMTSHDLARSADLATRFDVISHGIISASIHGQNLSPDGLLEFYRKSLENQLVEGLS